MAGHRFFAAIYDRMLAGNERAGLREMRSRLLRKAGGRTLELGAGTGLNLPHYPDSVTDLVLTEPDPHMARRLRRKLESEPLPFPVEVIEAGAERLPFADGAADGSRRARWQDRLERPWSVLAAGCRPNRETGKVIAQALDIEQSEEAELPGSGTALVRPVIQGVARRAA
jgi:ubiquinone/menaquinone biosynthesis C-methylase UbiE